MFFYGYVQAEVRPLQGRCPSEPPPELVRELLREAAGFRLLAP